MAKAKSGNEIPAWMEAQALMIKCKNVCIEEAIDLLYKEIGAKRMAISGTFMPMELERSGEMEQGLFLIRHLTDQKENLTRSFSDYIAKEESNPKALTPEKLARIEDAKKFIVAVEKITSLTDYGRTFADWFDSASMEVNEKDPSLILAKSSGGPKTHRTEALRSLVGSKLFKAEGLFTAEEKKLMVKALTLCGESSRK